MARENYIFLLIVLLCCANVISITVLTCCPSGETLTDDLKCVESNKSSSPVVYSPSKQTLLLPPGTIPSDFRFVRQFPNCTLPPLFIKDESNPVLTDDRGALWMNNVVYEPETFCISSVGSLVCLTAEHLEKRAKTEKKVHKCCPTGDIYSDNMGKCVTIVANRTNFLSEDTYIHPGFPPCETQEYAVAGKLDNDYSLNIDGTLTTMRNRPTIDSYCVEYILEHPNDKSASVFTCSTNYQSVRPDGDDIRYTLYPLGFFLSIFFLTITLISSFMLPSSYHALHWKCQTHYVACLLVGYVLMSITQLGSESIKGSVACVAIATAMHFFFLSAFFWLNTMCFNIWWTFRDLRPTSLDKSQETYRLVLYELYAWGGPLIIASVGTIMDQVLNDKYPAVLRPNFGHHSCWFRGNMEQFVYFYGPIGLLLLVNLVLFAATTRELTCGLWKREVVKSTTERTALSHICLKLVIVMGITWIVDVLSWAVGGPKYFWYLTDLVNALQGVFIFIVVGCQPQVWNAVKRMWCLSDSPSRNGGYSSNATPSIIDQSSTKPVETLC